MLTLICAHHVGVLVDDAVGGGLVVRVLAEARHGLPHWLSIKLLNHHRSSRQRLDGASDRHPSGLGGVVSCWHGVLVPAEVSLDGCRFAHVRGLFEFEAHFDVAGLEGVHGSAHSSSRLRKEPIHSGQRAVGP